MSSNFLTYAAVVLLAFSAATFLFGSYVGSNNKALSDVAFSAGATSHEKQVMTPSDDEASTETTPRNFSARREGAPRNSSSEDDKATSSADLTSGDAETSGTSSERPWYPSSLGQYRHTFGECGAEINSKARIPFSIIVPKGQLEESENITLSPFSQHTNATRFVQLPYSNATINDTRIWEELLPDMREAFATEHERCHYVMLRMLAIFASVMRQLRLNAWFVSHATLLGAVRHGGFIPWDVDIDVAMPKGHLTMLRRAWRKHFPRDMFLQTEKTENSFHMWVGKERAMRIKDRYSTFLGMRFSQYKRGKRYRMRPWHLGAHIDIIPLEKKGRGGYKLLHHIIPRSMLFPTTTLCFENILVPAPRNISGMLHEFYGPNYMQLPKNISFAGPTSLPCIATRPSKGSQWSLSWERDRPRGKPPKLSPRSDPYGSFEEDSKVPYTVYANNRG